MKDLKLAYENLKSNYSNFIIEAKQKTLGVSVAQLDFFSVEPMYRELNNLSSNDCQFSDLKDDLAPSTETFICAFDGTRLLQVRNLLAKDLYFDNFFHYTANEKWRLQIYHSGDVEKAIYVERLIIDDEGLPVCYEHYQGNAYRKYDYIFTNKIMRVECNHYDGDKNLVSKKQLEVYSSKNPIKIESITSIVNGNRESIYNVNNKISREELLESAKTAIVDLILNALEKEIDVDKDIECLLLEYTCQSPFPPHLGMSGKEKVKKGDYPLEYYWVNEMQYQLVDLYGSHDDLFSTVNHYWELDYAAIGDDLAEEEQNKKHNVIVEDIFNAYVDICQRLQKKSKIKELIPTTKTFHISARDYEDCNEWNFLQVLLPKPQVKSLQKKLHDYEQSSVLNTSQRVIYQDLQKTLTAEKNTFEQLDKKLSQKALLKRYSSLQCYYIAPFGFEVKQRMTNDWGDLKNSEQLSDTPIEGDHYCYSFDDNKIVRSTGYRNGKLWHETFYHYSDKIITEHDFKYYSSGLALQRFTQYQLKPLQNKPSLNKQAQLNQNSSLITSSKSYQDSEVIKTEYSYNEKGSLQKSIENRIMINHKYINIAEFINLFEYDDNKLFKITQLIKNNSKSTVVYCQDDSFIIDNINELAQAVVTSITNVLHDTSFDNVAAIVLPFKKELMFNIYDFNIVRKVKDSMQWFQKNADSSDKRLEELSMNFFCYTADKNLTKEQSRLYKQQAKNLLQKNLNTKINELYSSDIKVLIQAESQSVDEINKQLNS